MPEGLSVKQDAHEEEELGLVVEEVMQPRTALGVDL